MVSTLGSVVVANGVIGISVAWMVYELLVILIYVLYWRIYIYSVVHEWSYNTHKHPHTVLLWTLTQYMATMLVLKEYHPRIVSPRV